VPADPAAGGLPVGHEAAPPCDARPADPFAEVTWRPSALDDEILAALAPRPRDRHVLAPVTHHALLAEAAASLEAAAGETEDPVLTQGAALLGEEVMLLQILAVQRGVLRGA